MENTNRERKVINLKYRSTAYPMVLVDSNKKEFCIQRVIRESKFQGVSMNFENTPTPPNVYWLPLDYS